MNKQMTGVDSPITNLIERGLTSFWRVLKVSYIEKNDLYRLQFGYKSCFLFTNVAFRVQNLRFAYKYLIVNLQNCISNYKVASRNAIQPFFIKIVDYIDKFIFFAYNNITNKCKTTTIIWRCYYGRTSFNSISCR